MDQDDAILQETVPHMEYRASKRKYQGTYQPSYPGLTRLLFLFLLFLWGVRQAGFTTSGGDRTMYLILSWSIRDRSDVNLVIVLLSIIVLLTFTTSYHIAAGIHVTYIFLAMMTVVVVAGGFEGELKDRNYIDAQSFLIIVYLVTMVVLVVGHFVMRKLIPALHRGKSPLVRPCTWKGDWNDVEFTAMRQWAKLLAPVKQGTLNRMTAASRILPSCLFHESVVGYMGQVDEEGRPHGIGEWNTDQWHGEHYEGLWHHGNPIAPFRSREVGSSSSFVGHRIAYVQCRPELDPFKANVFPTFGPKMMWGIGSAESSASGVFFREYPYVYFMSRSEFLGVEGREDSDSNGPFEIPEITLDTQWLPSMFDDYDQAFGIVTQQGDVEAANAGLLPVRNTRWMHELLQGLSPPEASILDVDMEWREAADVLVYLDGAGRLQVSGHIQQAIVRSPNGFKTPPAKELRIRTVQRDLRQITLQSVPLQAMTLVGMSLTPSLDPNFAVSISSTSSSQRQGSTSINGDDDLGANSDLIALLSQQHSPAQHGELDDEPHPSANCLKVDGWVPRNRVCAYEAVLFIHGYNAWPENSINKLGQLSALGVLPNYIKPIVFAWPGGGHPLVYPSARHTCNARQVVQAFMEVLRALQAERVNAVHLLGHSMGARVVMAIAPAMLHGYIKGYLHLRCESITLLQPEYELHNFNKQDAKQMLQFCPIITVYGNGKDGALGPAEYMAPLWDNIDKNLPLWIVHPGARADRLYVQCQQEGMQEQGAAAGSTSRDSVGEGQQGNHTHAMMSRQQGLQLANGAVAAQQTDKTSAGAAASAGTHATASTGAGTDAAASTGADAATGTGAHGMASATLSAALGTAIGAGIGKYPKANTWWHKRMLGRAVDVGEVCDPVTGEFLDVDIVNTTYVQANVHELRHTFFHLNREIVDDLRDIIVSKRRAHQRSRLELVGGNVYGFLVAPTYVLNP